VATLRARLDAGFQAVGNYLRDSVEPRLVPTGGTTGHILTKQASGFAWAAAPAGGTDPWTYKKLAADYTNATATFANITDGVDPFTYTPPANSDWSLDARLLVWTTTPANLPRIGVAIAAGASRGYGAGNIWSPGATASTTVQANGGWANGAGVTAIQLAAGGFLTASVPYLVEISLHGRSGATPTAISLQMAMETAGANIGFVKRGSLMRTRTY
jgi:hypothetical protein